jgi:SAM-dependent methyltransferase
VESYDVFAPFYDAAEGDRSRQSANLRTLIERHHPAARTVLELACGTGSILGRLQPDYEVTGVDLSAQMLAIAAEKLPQALLVHADMTRLQLDRTFDVVLCVYDSINHLLRFSEWEAVFDRAREHLADGGIFVFDMNTEKRLADLIAEPAFTRWFGDDYLFVLDVTDGGNGVSNWRLDVFEHIEDSNYRLHSEVLREVAFGSERIRASLAGRFERIWAYDPERARPSPQTRRLHFVCRR